MTDETTGKKTGISNRESAGEEERERQEHPREPQAEPRRDQAELAEDAVADEWANRQTAHKAGTRSIAQKEDRTRYPDRSMPPTRKKAGAFGKEPREAAADEPRPDQSAPDQEAVERDET